MCVCLCVNVQHRMTHVIPMPINTFFCALAERFRTHAVAVVLSGTGASSKQRWPVQPELVDVRCACV